MRREIETIPDVVADALERLGRALSTSLASVVAARSTTCG